MFNILLVEDSDTCRLVATRALNSNEVEITSTSTVTDALSLLRKKTFDMFLLDLVLPDGDGLDILNVLQTNESLKSKPVLLLTQKEDLASKVSAFSLGADDYLIKPVNPIELRARVEMHLRKLSSNRKELETLKKGALTINIPMMKVSLAKNGLDESIELTSKEFKILTYLAQNEGKVFTRAELVKAIWGEGTHVVDRTVDSHVCGLRKKIEPFSEYVESIPGSGYRLLVKS